MNNALKSAQNKTYKIAFRYILVSETSIIQDIQRIRVNVRSNADCTYW